MEEFDHQSRLERPWIQESSSIEDLSPFGDSQASGDGHEASLRGGVETAGEIESKGSSTWEEAFLGVFGVLRKWLVGLRFLFEMGWPLRSGGEDTLEVKSLMMGDEAEGFMASKRRRLSSTSSPDTYEVEVVSEKGL